MGERGPHGETSTGKSNTWGREGHMERRVQGRVIHSGERDIQYGREANMGEKAIHSLEVKKREKNTRQWGWRHRGERAAGKEDPGREDHKGREP
jgi:hypothetical protein